MDRAKSILKWIELNPEKVKSEKDYHVEYNQDDSSRDHWVYLNPEWSVQGEELHTVHEYTVRDVLEVLNNLQKCYCESCCNSSKEVQAEKKRLDL